jgi:SNF family Na+-dependent transporter
MAGVEMLERKGDNRLGEFSGGADPDASDRARWGSKWEFLLSCVGNAVGLGNIWRFPYLAFKNGGAAFMIPYFLFTALFGLPLVFIEMAVGQRFQLGPSELWVKVSPYLRGLGTTGVLAGFILGLYYNVIIAWAFYYFFFSFVVPLPWRNGAEEYFYRDVLQAWPAGATASCEDVEDAGGTCEGYPSLGDPGGLNGPLVGFLALSWVTIWLCVYKGIASSGKIIWFTALFPYVVLFMLLIRGVTLTGAWRGIKFFLVPDWSRLGNIQVWIDAANQVFFSVGIGFGGMVTFSSYNAPNHNFLRDAWLVPLINASTSILGGFVVFAVLGHLSYLQDRPVEDVASDGPGLAFVVYPEAIVEFPGSNFFALMFFLMLLCLGIDSAFAIAETSLTCLKDAHVLPQVTGWRRPALYCFFCFLGGLLFVTRAGLAWVDLVDTYATAIALFLVGSLECVGIGWFYGIDRLSADIVDMVGAAPPRALLLHIKYVVPGCLVVLLGVAFWKRSEGVDFPGWAVAVGWLFAFFSLVPIIAGVVRTVADRHRGRAPGQSGLPREVEHERNGAQVTGHL